MDKKICSRIHRINYLNAEIDALYHHASLKSGLSDSASMVLYTIYYNGENCLLSDIYKKSGISRQTVNSAIHNLEKKHIVYLEQHTDRAKKDVLTDTEKGIEVIAALGKNCIIVVRSADVLLEQYNTSDWHIKDLIPVVANFAARCFG